jgi:hypothetical protein
VTHSNERTLHCIDGQTVADEISSEAICVFLVSCNVLKRLSVIRIAEEDNSRDVRGCCGGDLFHSKMDDLCPLTVRPGELACHSG